MRCAVTVATLLIATLAQALPALRQEQQTLQASEQHGHLFNRAVTFDAPEDGDKISEVPECSAKEHELTSKGSAPKPSDIKKVQRDCAADPNPTRPPPTEPSSVDGPVTHLFEGTLPESVSSSYSEPEGMCLPLDDNKSKELEKAISSGDDSQLASFVGQSSESSSSSSSTSSSPSDQGVTRFAEQGGPAVKCRWITAGNSGSQGFLTEGPWVKTKRTYSHGGKKWQTSGKSLFDYYTQLVGPVNCWAEENQLTSPKNPPASSIALSVYLRCTDASGATVPPPTDCKPKIHLRAHYKGSAIADSYTPGSCYGPEFLGGIAPEVAAEATHEVSMKVGSKTMFHKVCGAKSGPQITTTNSWSLGATGGAEVSAKDGAKAGVELSAGIGGSISMTHDFAKSTCDISGDYEQEVESSILSALFQTSGRAHLHTKSRGRGWSRSVSQEVFMGWAASASQSCKSVAASGYWGLAFKSGNQNQYSAFKHWAEPIMKASVQ